MYVSYKPAEADLTIFCRVAKLFRTGFPLYRKLYLFVFMITIVSGTNRPHSKSREVADFYQKLLLTHQAECQILDLSHLPADFTSTALYANSGKNEEFNSLRSIMEASEKFVFIVPEYNNSFPGVFKAFLDGLSYPNALMHKKCALVGLSDGVQGNALGLSHLTDVLNYLGMHVLAQKTRIPFMGRNFVRGTITDNFIKQLIEDQARLFLAF
jgi:chromate reductase, NAD(P)H dehydrogenase (quinone)